MPPATTGGPARSAAAGAVLYVTLEPCNHFGRTPPCSEAIVQAGIATVVIGMLDPNPLVDGSGADFLRKSGVAVISGVLEEQCRELNRGFIKQVSTGLPWVVLKAGLSLDGRITFRQGTRGLITGPQSLRQVHRLRDQLDAILVGIGTVIIDDPSLTTRLAGRSGRDPVRIILDTNLRIPEQARVLHHQSAAPTWIFCRTDADREKRRRLAERPGVVVFPVGTSPDNHLDLVAVLKTAAGHGVNSILVEGGATIHGAFLARHLVDRVNLFYAPLFAGDGGISVVEHFSSADDREKAVRLTDLRVRRYGDDLLVTGDVCYP